MDRHAPQAFKAAKIIFYDPASVSKKGSDHDTTAPMAP